MRSKIGRFAGKKVNAEILHELGKQEMPFNGRYYLDENKTEHWTMEHQFWLKHKRLFQDVGFLPEISVNKDKKMPAMLEKF